MFFLSTYFVPFLNFFLERGLRVGVKLRSLKLINGGGRGGLNKVRGGGGVLIRWGGGVGKKLEN